MVYLKPDTRCSEFGAHVVCRISLCDRCDYWYFACEECEVVTIGCDCGEYQSVDGVKIPRRPAEE